MRALKRSRADGASDAVKGTLTYFCHDKLNRITGTGASVNNCTSAAYTYDNLGNLVTKPDVSQYAYTANTNKLNGVNGQLLIYDVAGNITSDGIRNFAYEFNGSATIFLLRGSSCESLTVQLAHAEAVWQCVRDDAVLCAEIPLAYGSASLRI